MRPRTISAVALVLTAVTAGVTALDLPGVPRVVLTLLFLFFVPGWAVIAFFRPGTSSLTWALVVATSVALDLLGAQLMLLTVWRPGIATVGALGACAALLVAHLVAGRRAEGAPA